MNIRDFDKYLKQHETAISLYNFLIGDLVIINPVLSEMKYNDVDRFNAICNSSLSKNWYYTMRSIYEKHKKNPPKIFSYDEFDHTVIYSISKINRIIEDDADCCVHLVDIDDKNNKLIVPISVIIKYNNCNNKFIGNTFNNSNYKFGYFNSVKKIFNSDNTYLIRNTINPNSKWMKVIRIKDTAGNTFYRTCVNGIGMEFIFHSYYGDNTSIAQIDYDKYYFLEGTNNDPFVFGEPVLVKFSEDGETYVRSYYNTRVNKDGTITHFVSDKKNIAVEVAECKKYIADYTA